MVSAAPFRDRVVHHAICNVLEPIYEKQFIYDSYACRKGKVQHRAADRFTKFCRKNKYVLKYDIQYFPSINLGILLSILKRKIKDKNVIWLLETIINIKLFIRRMKNFQQLYKNNEMDLQSISHSISSLASIVILFFWSDDNIPSRRLSSAFLDDRLIPILITYLNWDK